MKICIYLTSFLMILIWIQFFNLHLKWKDPNSSLINQKIKSFETLSTISILSFFLPTTLQDLSFANSSFSLKKNSIFKRRMKKENESSISKSSKIKMSLKVSCSEAKKRTFTQSTWEESKLRSLTQTRRTSYSHLKKVIFTPNLMWISTFKLLTQMKIAIKLQKET